MESIRVTPNIGGAIAIAWDGGAIAGTWSGTLTVPPKPDAAVRDAAPDAGVTIDAQPADAGGTADGGLFGLYEPYAPVAGMVPPGAHLTEPALAEPAPLASYVDAPFGTTVRRGPAGTAADYSQLEAWSPSGNYLLVIDMLSGGYELLHWPDFAPVLAPGIIQDAALRWHPQKDLVVGVLGSPYRVVAWDVQGNLQTLLTTSFQTGGQSIVQEEISADGRYMALMGWNPGASGHTGDTILVADLIAGKVAASIPLASLCGGKTADDIDFVRSLTTLTAVQWHADGSGRCNGLELYDNVTGAFVRQLHAAHGHGDWGTSASGAELYLTEPDSLASQWNNNYTALQVQRVAGGAPTEVREIGWYADEHDSCRGLPGLCLISASPATAATFATRRSRTLAVAKAKLPAAWLVRDAAHAALHAKAAKKPVPKWARAVLVKNSAAHLALATATGPLDPMSGEEWLVELATGRAWRLVWNRTTAVDYWAQARGSLSRDGRWAIWTSDWGAGTGDDTKLSVFVVQVRP